MDLKKKILFWIDEKRDVIVVCLILLVVLVSIIFGLRMQQNYMVQKRTEEEVKRPQKVNLPAESAGNANTAKESSQSTATASFFLKPSPDEVLSLIQQMGEGELPPASQKYTGLRVMWPAFFFEIVHQEEGKATILLDVSEDGFGVLIQTEVDMGKFPEIQEVERGKKIWVAGEIQGVDNTGTGTIHMTAEEVRFQENLMDAVKGTKVQGSAAKSAPTTTEGVK